MNRIVLEGRKRTPQGDRGTAKKGITSVSTRGQQRRHLESKSNTAKSVKSPKNSKSAKPGKNSKGGIITTNRTDGVRRNSSSMMPLSQFSVALSSFLGLYVAVR